RDRNVTGVQTCALPIWPRGPRAERLVDPFHQGRDAHPHPHAPGGERRDEEIVALADLVLQPRSAEGLRITPLEVEIENERDGEEIGRASCRERVKNTRT